jgi:tRNA (guanine37-N1)-methyltransferase
MWREVVDVEQDGIILPLYMAEKALRLLRRLKLVDNERQIVRTEKEIIVPLLRALTNNEATLMKEQIGEVRSQHASFERLEMKPRTLGEYLRGKIPEEFVQSLPASFDTVGDVAIMKLPEVLEPFSDAVGRGIIETNPHIRLALKKVGQVEGRFRTRRVIAVAGVGGTETLHKEFSCRYHVDVSTVYFNPRLSYERMRVAKQVVPGESVVDMFAGVGPYSVLIAKLQPSSTVYAVDINPAAVKYLKENAFANHVADRVLPLLGDVKVLARKGLQGLANRVIMNLPTEAANYLPAASQILRDAGGIIHFYSFSPREQKIDAVLNSFRSIVEEQNRKVELVRFCKVIREVAPNRVQVAIDALLSAKAPQ